MNPRSRKGSWRFIRLFTLLAALLVSTGGKTYAQTHGFGTFGHGGQESAGTHGAATRPHWGVRQHGFAYGSGNGSYRSPDWGYGPFGYAPYGGPYSSAAPFYAYPLHTRPVYAYFRGHQPRYYVHGITGPGITGDGVPATMVVTETLCR